MIGFLASIPGKLWGYLAIAGGAVLVVLRIYAKGRHDAEVKDALDDARDYQDTRKDMDDVETPDNADDAREWLRNRKP